MKFLGYNKTIFRASITVFFITIISKIIAYLESAILAAYFGTSSEIDMFYLANSIVMRFIFTIFAGLSIVVVIMYNAVRESKYTHACTFESDNIKTSSTNIEKNKEEGIFISALLTFAIPVALVVTCVLYLLAPFMSKLMTTNYTVYEEYLLCQYIKVFSTVAICYVVCTIFTAVLNANKLFIPGVFCIIIQNIVLIAFIIFLSPYFRVWAVVVGFLIGYILQGIFLFKYIRKIIKIRIGFITSLNIKYLLSLLFPLILGDASGELNLLVDQFIATKLGSGYISALSYSGSLDDFVSSFFIQTVAHILLPFLSTMMIEKRYADVSEEMRKVINITILILLPITIVTVFSPQLIVSIVYERGCFDKHSVLMTSWALTGYGLGFIFKAIFIILRRPFYAIGDTKVPMFLSIFSVIVNIILTFFLSQFWGIFGITFATTIAFGIGDVMTFIAINKRVIRINWHDELSFLYKLAIAGIISMASVFLITEERQPLSDIVYLLISTIVCFAVYSLCLWLLHVKEFEKVLELVHKKKIKNVL